MSHTFEANPGMYDTSERFCSKCGVAESAVVHMHECGAWRLGKSHKPCSCGGVEPCDNLERRTVKMLREVDIILSKSPRFADDLDVLRRLNETIMPIGWRWVLPRLLADLERARELLRQAQPYVCVPQRPLFDEIDAYLNRAAEAQKDESK